MKREEYDRLCNERLAHAKRLLDDGFSREQAARTAHVSRQKLERLFPELKWTAQHASAIGAEVRRANRELERLGFGRMEGGKGG